jgi:hypothetical protein
VTLADRIIDHLMRAESPLDDDQLAAVLGVDRHHVNAVSRKLESEGRLRRSKLVGGKIVNSLDELAVDDPSSRRGTPGLERAVPVESTGRIASGREFEEHARLVLSKQWDLALSSQNVMLAGGVRHSFDLVSSDGMVVGDAKWYKDLNPIPSAKLSVIGEYVWLLGHLISVERRFIVFGQDRAVPERWLRRYESLLGGVEFWWLEGDDPERMA